MPKCPNCTSHLQGRPIKNGILGDSESKCISALDAEISLGNFKRRVSCNLF